MKIIININLEDGTEPIVIETKNENVLKKFYKLLTTKVDETFLLTENENKLLNELPNKFSTNDAEYFCLKLGFYKTFFKLSMSRKPNFRKLFVKVSHGVYIKKASC